MTNDAAERLRANAADRIAKLNPGQGGTAARREQNKRWARILIEQTLADAEEALAAERRATVEPIVQYVTQNRDAWQDVPTDPPGARQLASAYRDIYQKVLNVVEGREPLDDGILDAEAER